MDEKKKVVKPTEPVRELTPDDLDGALGGDSFFDDVPRVDEHKYTPEEKKDL